MKIKKNPATSIRDRLLIYAREQNRPFQEILQYYAMERFLYRLSKTVFKDQFILKGGLVFYALDLNLRRVTRDIDFRSYAQNETTTIKQILNEIWLDSSVFDGLMYMDETLKFKTIDTDGDYQGLSAKFEVKLENARISMHIDFGFSDRVYPKFEKIKYPVIFTQAFVIEKQLDWTQFLKKNKIEEQACKNFEDVLRKIQQFIMPLLNGDLDCENNNYYWNQKKVYWELNT